ncbi:hypothetical protein Y032_0005g2332 [Ancylostoma ceylanicum]|uniref:Uncharacterized protein n=1 Tax=Ancylostoma ceylanicum TaxID=53326 RepID=A0A016VS91_9BILA|nr:hypothetical protein Y032_0005g2332 [Ancylostoma ceylanicum]
MTRSPGQFQTNSFPVMTTVFTTTSAIGQTTAQYASSFTLLNPILALSKLWFRNNLHFSAQTTFTFLTPVSPLSYNSGSFRSRVESLKTSIAELLHLLTDVFIHSEALFGRDVKDVVQQPIDKGVENFLAKLKSWQYWLDSHGRPRSLEDIITVCSASGQLVFGIQEFKTMVTESSLSPNIKPVLKWNRGVCDLVLRTAVEKVVQKMKTKIEEIKSTVPTEPRMINLPSFSTSPHEYITTTGQELLQLFHLWEQFFLDDNVVYSFFIALKKKFEGDHSSFS